MANTPFMHMPSLYPLSLAFLPLVSTIVNITTTLKKIANTSLIWVKINIKFYFPFCHNTFFMGKTLALESTFNICIHHFEFHTLGENKICPLVEDVNTDSIKLKSV